jgi:hypothetical protein
VKNEHTDWLDANVVRLLRPCKDLRVSLSGSTDRRGNQDYNWRLSERRVEAVRNHLVTRGVDSGQIDIRWSGEENAIAKGEKDGTDNDEDRAVFLRIPVPSRRERVRFERPFPAPDDPYFITHDSFGGDPELYLPSAGFRRYLNVLNAEGMTLRSNDPFIAGVVSTITNTRAEEVLITSNRELIRVEGWMPGDTNIWAFDFDNPEVDLDGLDVHVLGPKTIDIVFYYVKDPTHRTTRPLPSAAAAAALLDEDRLLEVVNEIFQPQANITVFKREPGMPLKFTQDLGNTVTQATVGDDWHVLTDRVENPARINVFFIWDIDFPGDGHEHAISRVPGQYLILSDRTDSVVKNPGVTLAHEVGHCLGLPHNTHPSSDLLMWKWHNPQGRGRRLEILERNIANDKAMLFY